MNSRSGLVTFLLFLFLATMIMFQVLSMIQADRLYERLNLLIDRQSNVTYTTTSQHQKDSANDLPMDEYPGDEGDWLVWSLSVEPATLNDLHDSGGLASQKPCFRRPGLSETV